MGVTFGQYHLIVVDVEVNSSCLMYPIMTLNYLHSLGAKQLILLNREVGATFFFMHWHLLQELNIFLPTSQAMSFITTFLVSNSMRHRHYSQ
jgi:hypothetical protein